MGAFNKSEFLPSPSVASQICLRSNPVGSVGQILTIGRGRGFECKHLLSYNLMFSIKAKTQARYIDNDLCSRGKEDSVRL